MKKGIIRVLICCLTVILFAGCNNNVASQEQPEPPSEPDIVIEDTINLFEKSGMTESEIVAWALGSSAILATYNNYNPYQFGMFAKNDETAALAKSILSEVWDCTGKKDLQDTIIALANNIDSVDFVDSYNIVSAMTEKQYASLIESSEGIDVYMWPLTKAIGDKWGDKQIRAWDWFRMMHITGWGYIAGYLEMEEAFDYLSLGANLLKGTFASWEEANENYLDGFAWRNRLDISNSNSPNDFTDRVKVYEQIKSYPTDFSLFDPTIWPGYVQGDNEYVAITDAEYLNIFMYRKNGDGTCTISGFRSEKGNLIIPKEIDGLTVTAIEEKAFRNASGFTGRLIIPDSVTTIESEAFSSCTGLSGILLIPDSITSIGEAAFRGCASLTGKLLIPDSLTSIEKDTFRECAGFSGDLIIPDSIVSIGSSAFMDCAGFSGSLKLPGGLDKVVNSVFSGCTGLTGELMIPENVTEIGGDAFRDCSGFSGSLVLPEGLASIESTAFQNCGGFTGILTIPAGVTFIGANTFEGCNGLSEVVFLGDAPKVRKLPFGERAGDFRISYDPAMADWETPEWNGYPCFPKS